jgi:hypothetical protein
MTQTLYAHINKIKIKKESHRQKKKKNIALGWKGRRRFTNLMALKTGRSSNT